MKKRAASDYQKRAGGQKRFKLLAALMLLPALVHAQQGDTGQTVCTDTTGAAIVCAALTDHPGQDGRYGRDAQAGAPAFNYAALDASGNATTFGGHACVADQVTGLVWSTATLAMPWGAVPAAPRCGIATGWRLPTRRELLSIVHHGAASPAIAAAAFPATQSAPYWSSDSTGANAWALDFSDGDTRLLPQAQTHAARLVARPVNEAPTLTLGAADIVLSNLERPRAQTYPGWATGITPGPAREAGQRLTASVRLLPVPGIKTLEFDEPPSIDLATGDLRFTVLHRIDPKGQLSGQDVFYWTSSAGRARVEVTLQDDGGTAGGGVDTTVKSFEIFVSPVPVAADLNYKHPWHAACVPIGIYAQDIDTDPQVEATYPKQYWPYFKIKEYPQEGYLANYVAVSSLAAKSISVPLGNDIPASEAWGVTGRAPPVAGDTSPWGGFFVSTMCWVPISSTFTGTDSFTYTAVDVDGNESAPAMVTIEIFE